LEKLLCKDQFNSPRRHRDAEDLIAAVEGSSAVVLPFRRMRIGSNGPAVTRYLPLIAPKMHQVRRRADGPQLSPNARRMVAEFDAARAAMHASPASGSGDARSNRYFEIVERPRGCDYE
jgi:hypothetical protein